MLQNTGSRRQRQRTSRWNHFFYFAASGGTFLLIYRISGGFPPSTWVRFWNILAQINSLWAASGFSVCLLIFVVGFQALLLLLVWGTCVGFLVYEAYMLLGALSVWQNLSFFERWFTTLRMYLSTHTSRRFPFAPRGQQLAVLSTGHALPVAALPTPSSPVATVPSAPSSADRATLPTFTEIALPERGNMLSNTMSPALPESMRWILRSPDFLTQNAQKVQAEQILTLADNHTVQDLPPNPSEEGIFSSASPDNRELKLAEDLLANPFEVQREPGLAEDLLANPFEVQREPGLAEDLLANPFEVQEEIEDATLPSIASGKQELHSAGNPLANPFEDDEEIEDTLPSIFKGNQEWVAIEDLPTNPLGIDDEVDNTPVSVGTERQASQPVEDLPTNPLIVENEVASIGTERQASQPVEDLPTNPLAAEEEISEVFLSIILEQQKMEVSEDLPGSSFGAEDLSVTALEDLNERLSLPSAEDQEAEEDPLANPFENVEEDLLPNPFEEDPSADKEVEPTEDPLANPFEEEAKQSPPDVPSEQQESKPTKNLLSTLEDKIDNPYPLHS